ncbi:MAG TPA: polysaccharide deacetylase, partial [Caulobacteraceae bacterium]|nr:polysaccharide deacetylase [Caulobacteraceae bacterium]
MSDFIFHDPSGRRARRAALLGGLLIAAVAAVVAAFFATLAFAPRLPDVHLKDPRVFSALHVETAKKIKFHPTLTRVPRRPRAANGAAKPLTVGFYVPWDERSRVSLAAHLNQLDVFAPQWITPKGSLG